MQRQLWEPIAVGELDFIKNICRFLRYSSLFLEMISSSQIDCVVHFQVC